MFYFKHVVAEVKETFAPILEKYGLKVRAVMEDGDLRVDFDVDEKSFSPVSIRFFGRATTKKKLASWENVQVEMECYHPIDLGDTGWRYWELQGTCDYELDGTAEENKRAIAEWLEDIEIIQAGDNIPNIASSPSIAEAYEHVERAAGLHATVEFVRDDQGNEKLRFVSTDGREFVLEFPPAFDDQDVVLSIDGQEVERINSSHEREVGRAVDKWLHDRAARRTELPKSGT